MIKRYFFLSTILFLAACSEEVKAPKKIEKKIELSSIKPDFKDSDLFENSIISINIDKNLFEAKSLSYTDNQATIHEVIALVDSSMNFSKLTQLAIEQNGRQIETAFYFIGTQLFASVRTITKFTENQGFVREIKTYYSENREVLISAERKAKVSENIQSVAYKTINKTAHDPSEALNIINQTGGFQTNFLGFNEANGKLYINVGTENYNSSLVVNELSPLLKNMKANESKYFNKRLKIEFEEVNQLDGFSYKSLISFQLLPK